MPITLQTGIREYTGEISDTYCAGVNCGGLTPQLEDEFLHRMDVASVQKYGKMKRRQLKKFAKRDSARHYNRQFARYMLSDKMRQRLDRVTNKMYIDIFNEKLKEGYKLPYSKRIPVKKINRIEYKSKQKSKQK